MDGLRGVSGHYWEREKLKWWNLAVVCRLGGQSIFQLLGRDPLREPLDATEMALFTNSLSDVAKIQNGGDDDEDFVRGEPQEPPEPEIKE